IPNKIAADSIPSGTSSHGLSWHRLGIDGNFPSGLLAGRKPGGMKYSNSRGKVCPGDAKIRQVADVFARAQEILGGAAPKPPSGGGGKGKPAPKPTTPTKPTPAKSYPDIPLLVDGDWGSLTTKALQLVLPKKYNGGRAARSEEHTPE